MPRKKRFKGKPPVIEIHLYSAGITFSDHRKRDNNHRETEGAFWRAFAYLPILGLLKRKGWKVEADPTTKGCRYLGKDRRRASKGNLEIWIENNPSGISLKFNSTEGKPENPNGHRYGFNHYLKMSRIDQRRYQLIRRDLIAFFERKTKGCYTDRSASQDDFSPLTALEKIEHDYATSWHSKPELGRPEASPYNSKSRDGKVIQHGATVWAIDYFSKRIIRGTAMVNINNMWWVLVNKTERHNIANFDIWVDQPDDLRRKRNDRERRIKLEKELALAMQRMDFARAEILKKLLFQDEGVYLIWARDKDAYYCSQYNGYTADKIHAGKYLKCEAEAECRRVPHELSMVTPEGKHIRFDQEGAA